MGLAWKLIAEIEGAMKDSEFSADGESRAQRTQEDLGAGKVESCWRVLRAHKKGRVNVLFQFTHQRIPGSDFTQF
jgi:hypothetical protein